jgi:predicted solute-binding protein
MTDNKTANELAHSITTEAAAPTRAIRDLAKELGLPEKDVESYLSKIAYRRAYNMRPEVVAARKVRNAEKAAVQKAIRECIKASGRVELLNKLAEGMVTK